MGNTSNDLDGSFGWHNPAHVLIFLTMVVRGVEVDTSSQLFWGLCTAFLIIPTACAVTFKTDFITETFPIEVNTIEMSTEGPLSESSEIVYEFTELRFGPLSQRERSAPRSHNHSNCNTILFDSLQVRLEFCENSWGDVFSGETEWEEPSLLLGASVGIVLSWVEPMSWVVNLNIGNERDLIAWGV